MSLAGTQHYSSEPWLSQLTKYSDPLSSMKAGYPTPCMLAEHLCLDAQVGSWVAYPPQEGQE